jgi:hypothetical protein
MLGLPAGYHPSAASTELQLSDLRLLRVAAATLQPASFLLSHGAYLTLIPEIQT